MKTEGVVKRLGERVANSKNAETPEFVGRAIVALEHDPNIINLSGKVLIVQELADKYGFTDVEGHTPKDRVIRSLRQKHMQTPPPYWTI